ncbi:MAG TPA: DUF885 domain-containing protein [Chthoniobacterales bacterium]|jgi:uncharacterized protein (DUF885 family)|nr:DUF885 domain-containing protein [Chthoniobacterales bacterium]
MRRLVLALCAFGFAYAGQCATPSEEFIAQGKEFLAKRDSGSDPERLHRLFQFSWEYTMKENPEFATNVGYPGQNHRWSDLSLDAIARRKETARLDLELIKSIDRAKLTGNDVISYDLYRRDAELSVEGQQFPFEFLQINQMGGVQQNVAQVVSSTTFKNTKDYEDLVARLNAVPALVDQTIALLEKGLEQKFTPPQITLRDVPQQVLNLIVKDPAESPMLAPFKEMPGVVPAADQTRLRQAATDAFMSKVAPAFQKLHDFLVAKYLPGARTTLAANKLPNGDKLYAFSARQQTTTELAPAQIHEIGLAEVKRIRAEMEKVIVSTGFKGDFHAFMKYLLTDPKFYYTDAQSLLTGYRDVAKQIDAKLVEFFGILPRLPYGVKAVPAYAEKSQAAAYYEAGSLKAGRPGYFFVNTYDLPGRPKWGMETLTLHEAVPGHHFQIAISQEMDDLPEFRKHGGYNAFSEGWALYAESLGYEMGFFKDPYQNFGHLGDEMLRAIRLVVDTGLHSKDWTREQAIKYFEENSNNPPHDIVVEVDRYIVWPGQALGYKIGQLKIRELRTYAEKELGPKMDLRGFHDEVLKNGGLPMNVLETQIKQWVAKRKTS